MTPCSRYSFPPLPISQNITLISNLTVLHKTFCHFQCSHISKELVPGLASGVAISYQDNIICRSQGPILGTIFSSLQAYGLWRESPPARPVPPLACMYAGRADQKCIQKFLVKIDDLVTLIFSYLCLHAQSDLHSGQELRNTIGIWNARNLCYSLHEPTH